MYRKEINQQSPLRILEKCIHGGLGKGNRHIVLPPKTEIGNLWLSVANKFGASLDAFGESTGTVDLF